tara:strand:+ start:44 stop:1291 length:1248 start_codon:yes stop_codon:yes gene_type:complete
MRIFRINLYLSFSIFIRSIFTDKIKDESINKFFIKITKKNNFFYTSQLRSSFLLVLLYLKDKFKDRNEILMSSYNLKEMVNIPFQLKLKTIFYDLNPQVGSALISDIRKKINNKTLCLVMSNIFNDYETCIALKVLCKKKKIILIEDNAIYFDNYIKFKRRKFFAGSFGDYTLFSFNIMKNMSSLYGGLVCSNDKKFNTFAKNSVNNKNLNFPKILYAKQIITFLILKIFSFNYLYKSIFYYFFYFCNKYEINFIKKIIYPSLKFKKKIIPNYYLSKITKFSKKILYLQISNLNKRKQNHTNRKNKNKYYDKVLKLIKSKHVTLLRINNYDFQNYLEYPALFKDKEKLHQYLFTKGFDTKKIQYFDCSKEFKGKFICTNSKKFENEILCLPNHNKINNIYIDKIANEIKKFYEKH